jgi:hypothetical protein
MGRNFGSAINQQVLTSLWVHATLASRSLFIDLGYWGKPNMDVA